MLSDAELSETAAEFGVAEDQVRRDHLISHLLRAIADAELPLVFFGGTALARTHLTDPARGGRLSEDIDLHTPERARLASILDSALPRALRREFPGLACDPALSRTMHLEPASLVTGDALRVRIQLIDSRDHHELRSWPSERREVSLRYSDLPTSVTMSVPTLPAFVAMKTAAWLDRRTARDLYDLAALANLGAITSEAAGLYRHIAGVQVTQHYFDRQACGDWESQLRHQTLDPGTPEAALATVISAFAHALGWEE
ncbi:nucleotidyl transferase AbiEii/AbiGii toxin family protein [Actinocrinis sp.]|uniref:nucleotidyl transferase AbiEii/AbiGii toxin family protein n=1 Tax=Actinocrinis sp. TaxID=1920516 RepID=UPI002D347149|nr:nucleotidyl transferase AbiEii/AbiGii toxin family protein [Actinocrinis sp.]HZP52814.1 nucleotidyl transferase AbiEii/AbiGii toxin family protein [Actinocrinis sp.]